MNKYKGSTNISNTSLSSLPLTNLATKNMANGPYDYSKAYDKSLQTGDFLALDRSDSMKDDVIDKNYDYYPKAGEKIPRIFAERRIITCFHLDPYSLHKAFPSDIPDMTLVCEACMPQKGNPKPFSLRTLKNQSFRFEIFKAGIKHISQRMTEKPYRKKEPFIFEFIEFFNARASDKEKALALGYLLKTSHLRPIVFQFTWDKINPNDNGEFSPIHHLDHIFVELVFDKLWYMFAVWHKAKNEKGLFNYDEDEEQGKDGKKRDPNLYNDMPYGYLDEDMDVAQKLDQKEFIKDNSDYHPSKKSEDLTSNVNSGTGFWDYRDKIFKEDNVKKLVYIPEATMNKNPDEDLDELPYRRYIRDYQLENDFLNMFIIRSSTTKKVCELFKKVDTALRYIVQGEVKQQLGLEFRASLQEEDFKNKKLFFMFEINTLKKFVFVWLNQARNHWELVRYDFHTAELGVKDRLFQEDFDREIERFSQGFAFMMNDLIRYALLIKPSPSYKNREYIINTTVSPVKLNRKITIYVMRVMTEKWEYVIDKKEIDVDKDEIMKIFDRDFDYKGY